MISDEKERYQGYAMDAEPTCMDRRSGRQDATISGTRQAEMARVRDVVRKGKRMREV
jgi:hypothetical protein